MKEEPLATLRQCGAYEGIGADHFFQLGDDVIGQVLRHLQPSVCATCQVRVFANCQGQPGAV
jgi:SulP family sulfate permease